MANSHAGRCIIVALALGVAAPGHAFEKLRPCSETAGPDRWPCLGDWGWVLAPGLLAGYRHDQASRAHVGLDVGLLFGPVTDWGGTKDFDSYLLGGTLTLGYMTSPHAFRGELAVEFALPLWGRLYEKTGLLQKLLRYGGISFGPALTVDSDGTRAGFAATGWAGGPALVYLRWGADLPWRAFIETGVLLKVPFPSFGWFQ